MTTALVMGQAFLQQPPATQEPQQTVPPTASEESLDDLLARGADEAAIKAAALTLEDLIKIARCDRLPLHLQIWAQGNIQVKLRQRGAEGIIELLEPLFAALGDNDMELALAYQIRNAQDNEQRDRIAAALASLLITRPNLSNSVFRAFKWIILDEAIPEDTIAWATEKLKELISGNPKLAHNVFHVWGHGGFLYKCRCKKQANDMASVLLAIGSNPRLTLSMRSNVYVGLIQDGALVETRVQEAIQQLGQLAQMPENANHIIQDIQRILNTGTGLLVSTRILLAKALLAISSYESLPIPLRFKAIVGLMDFTSSDAIGDEAAQHLITLAKQPDETARAAVIQGLMARLQNQYLAAHSAQRIKTVLASINSSD
ncbi:MAG TPA: hypothetical protein PLV25_02405 [Opitutales bacterium]|nr:hypothetical protein [Opitutales bacterium]